MANPTHDSPDQLARLVALAREHDAAHRLADSERTYREILRLRPDLAEAHVNLGNALKDQGRLDEAVTHYETALALRPALFQVYNNLADIFERQGALDRAIHSYERVLAVRPDLAEVHGNLAATLVRYGQLERAAVHFARALALRPNYVQAHVHFAALLQKQGQLDRAAEHYQHALSLRPDLALAHNNLGLLLAGQGRFEEAAGHYRQALVLEPAARTHLNLANALKEQGRIDEAVVQVETALTIEPGDAPLHNSLADLLRTQGRLDQARAEYQTALALKPDYAEVYYDRARLKTFRADDPELAELEALVAQPGPLLQNKMAPLHFALGKALDDAGQHERAFQQWVAGNAIKRRGVDYDEAAQLEAFRLVTEMFDAGTLARFTGAGDPSGLPIFILGMPRSGSTLVEQILASHPAVYAAGELDILSRLVDTARDSRGRLISSAGFISSLDAETLQRLGRTYLAGLPPVPAGKTRVTDKNPGNFVYVGLIRLILPNAKIIHTVRDPVDTCISCFSRLLTVGHQFSYDLAELGHYYRGYSQLMDHWRAALPPGGMLDVRYEDVVDNLEEQARRLLDFCGLPWDDRCLRFHKTERPVATLSNVQVRQPIYRGSLERWRRYESQLGPLWDALEGRDQPVAPKRVIPQPPPAPAASGAAPDSSAEVNRLAALAEQEHHAGRLIEAEQAYHQIIRLRPDIAAAYVNLGNVLQHQSRLDESVVQYQRALAIDPSLYQAHTCLGNALAAQGKFAEATAQYDRALALRPDFVDAHYNRADVRKFHRGDGELAALEQLAANLGRFLPLERTRIHFALGKALEDVGDYDRAFQQLLAGNALKRQAIDYDPAREEQAFQLIAQAFDAGLFERLRAAGDPSTVPIFIVGMPRSGTSLVEQILASHPAVHGGGELWTMRRVATGVIDPQGQPIPFPQYVGEADAGFFGQLGRNYLAGLPRTAAGQTRVTDKTPGNFTYAGLIRLMLPRAKIIHATRDPIDTCLSCFSKLFVFGQAFAYDLAELGNYHRRYSKLMDHWRAVLPAGTMLDVRYEDVVDNLEEQARRLLEFCGLPWDERCLDFHQTDRPVNTASGLQVRRPIYRTSLQRWRRYEAHLGPLFSALGLPEPGPAAAAGQAHVR